MLDTTSSPPTTDTVALTSTLAVSTAELTTNEAPVVTPTLLPAWIGSPLAYVHAYDSVPPVGSVEADTVNVA